MQYLAEGILPQRHSERYKLKRLATRYILHDMVLFKKGYDGYPLKCLGPEEAREMIKEVHAFGRVWGATGKEKALQMPATNGLLLAYHEKRYDKICEKVPQLPSASQLDSHSLVELT